MHIAFQENHLEIVKLLIYSGANIENKTKEGDTTLHIVSLNGHLEIAKYLILSGANIQNKTNHGFTALHIAYKKNHIEIVKYLISHGACPMRVTDFGTSLFDEILYSVLHDKLFDPSDDTICIFCEPNESVAN